MVKKLYKGLFLSLFFVQNLFCTGEDDATKVIPKKNCETDQQQTTFLKDEDKTSLAPVFVATNRMFVMYSAKKTK